MADKILNSFDVWITAQGLKSKGRLRRVDNISLEGIDRLRELILELAIRGKLVPQDVSETPANVLITQIEEERQKLVKDGKIKNVSSQSSIGADEKPFVLPRGWEFVRFGEVTFNRDAERIPLSVDERSGRKGDYDYYGASGVIDSIDDYLFDKPLLLIGEDGANLINRSTPIAFIARGKFWVNNHAHVIDGISEDFLKYLCLHINAISLEAYVTGTAQPKMNQAKMNQIVLALPPLQEQKRIIAKVDELMALCDELETQETHHLKSHQLLVATLLDTLTQVSDATGFQSNWSRLAEHFDDIFTTEDSIDQLKQAILQLAVTGKLIRQDPSDEPASELLREIEKEKERLVSEGSIKREKPLLGINEQDIPFQRPRGWEFIRLGQLTSKIGSGSTPRGGSESYTDDGVIFLRSQNVWDSGLDLSDVAYISEQTHENMANTKVMANDILLNITGGSLGRSTIIPESFPEANVSQHVTIIRPTDPRTRFFLHLCILSPYGQNLIWGRQVGANREGLSKKILELFEIPVPPMNEQVRIIRKVEELFAVCDRLMARLIESQEITNNLANSILNLI